MAAGAIDAVTLEPREDQRTDEVCRGCMRKWALDEDEPWPQCRSRGAFISLDPDRDRETGECPYGHSP